MYSGHDNAFTALPCCVTLGYGIQSQGSFCIIGLGFIVFEHKSRCKPLPTPIELDRFRVLGFGSLGFRGLGCKVKGTI